MRGMALFRRSRSEQPQDAPAGDPYFRLGGMRLYQPDDELAVRLPQGVGEVAAYAKTLAWVGTEYFGRLQRDFGSLGVLMAVGVKPGRKTMVWAEAVDGAIPPDVWDPFVGLLVGAGSGVWPTVNAPVAFALECVMGAGPTTAFPEIPRVWVEAARGTGGTDPLAIPDDLFTFVFPG